MTNSTPSDEAADAGRGRPNERFPRAARLRRSQEIRDTLRTGRRRSWPAFDAFLAPSPSGRSRAAVIVPRYGHSAVARNRVRRRLQDLVRREWLPATREAGRRIDLVIRAKPRAYGTPYPDLRAFFQKLMDSECATSSSD